MSNWLITGVSGGLGREIAMAALARGDAVAGTVRRPEDQASRARQPTVSAHAALLLQAPANLQSNTDQSVRRMQKELRRLLEAFAAA